MSAAFCNSVALTFFCVEDRMGLVAKGGYHEAFAEALALSFCAVYGEAAYGAEGRISFCSRWYLPYNPVETTRLRLNFPPSDSAPTEEAIIILSALSPRQSYFFMFLNNFKV
jgi:hypothetical protein